MIRFLIRVIVNILIGGMAIGLTAAILPGLHLQTTNYLVTLLWLGVILGVINTFIRPVVNFLSLPLTILSLGLFQIVLNALLLYLVSIIVPNFTIDTFWWAVAGGLVLGIVYAILEAIFGLLGLSPKPKPRHANNN